MRDARRLARDSQVPVKRGSGISRWRGTRMTGKADKRWSRGVTEGSNALDLEPGVFTLNDPREIAHSLKRSADRSRRRKSDPFRSAMSMLTFYINRAGANLTSRRRARLETAKDELRELYRKPERRGRRRKGPGTTGARS
jgi:uncharacterized protein DUF3175